MIVVFCNANAQSKNASYERGYASNIEVGATVMTDLGTMPTSSIVSCHRGRHLEVLLAYRCGYPEVCICNSKTLR